MSKKRYHIITTVHCDKAARSGNEDNCLVRMDLADEKVTHVGDGVYLSEKVELGPRGSLLVLADGMGGMNAGEVASSIAVNSVSNYFSTQMTEDEKFDDDLTFKFIEQAVVYADECIKSQAAKNPEQSGLGTTIVILWLREGKAYVGWCGDSRIYRYNMVSQELERLSHDHSLVQFWMDSGQLTEEEAFHHPQSNIIMRSLGDSPDPVELEMLKTPLTLHHGDVFLLCSDGLCGMLRDYEIERLMNEASEKFGADGIDKWNDMLWDAAESEGWTDNVTSMLCCVQGGGEVKAGAEAPAPKPVTEEDPVSDSSTQESGEQPADSLSQKANPGTVTPTGAVPIKRMANRKRGTVIAVGVVLLLLLAAICFLFAKGILLPSQKRSEAHTQTVPMVSFEDVNHLNIR